MLPATRRSVIAFVVVALLAIGVCGIIGSAQTTEEVAKAWAAGLSLPEKMALGDRMETLRPEYQRALYFSLTYSQQTKLRQGRYITYLNLHPDLQPVQKQALQAAIDAENSDWTYEQVAANQEFVSRINGELRRVLGPGVIGLFNFRNGAVMTEDRTLLAGPRHVVNLPVRVRFKQAIADAVLAFADPSDVGCDCRVVASACDGTQLVCQEYQTSHCTPMAGEENGKRYGCDLTWGNMCLGLCVSGGSH